MEILMVWVETFVRWLHVIAGIAWIGSSFYFVHLDLSLKKSPALDPDAYGDTWQVHGGGFYHMTKYLVAPATMPEHLTWFYWEAYATWLSGFGLMVLVYYLGAELFLIDKNVLDLSTGAAIALSVGSLILGWVVYDGLCRAFAAQNTNILIATGFVFFVVMAIVFEKIFSARGAFMQIGALIGTIMAANVLMVIIPGQRKVVAELIAGRKPDPIHGQRGKQRSLHNNYLTLPVVFIMIANHYPLAFATRWAWAIIGLILVMGGVIRHFYNVRHTGAPSPWWTWGLAVGCGIGVVVLSMQGPAQRVSGDKRAEAPSPSASLLRPVTFTASAPKSVAFKDVEEVVLTRCSMCHMAEPAGTYGLYVPPKGVMLDTPEHIKSHRREIALQAVWSSAMPPGNITEITPEERQILADWIAAGQ